MSSELFRVFLDYYRTTIEYEIPLWAHGLYFYEEGVDLLGDLHFSWDYDLTNDGVVLRERRVGRERPFEYAPGFWRRMQRRECHLALEQIDQ